MKIEAKAVLSEFLRLEEVDPMSFYSVKFSKNILENTVKLRDHASYLRRYTILITQFKNNNDLPGHYEFFYNFCRKLDLKFDEEDNSKLPDIFLNNKDFDEAIEELKKDEKIQETIEEIKRKLNFDSLNLPKRAFEIVFDGWQSKIDLDYLKKEKLVDENQLKSIYYLFLNKF